MLLYVVTNMMIIIVVTHLRLQRVHEEAAADGGVQAVRGGGAGVGAAGGRARQAAQAQVRLRHQAQKSGERGDGSHFSLIEISYPLFKLRLKLKRF